MFLIYIEPGPFGKVVHYSLCYKRFCVIIGLVTLVYVMRL